MNKQLVYALLGILILSLFGGLAASQQVVTVERAVPVPAFDSKAEFDSQNFTKLEISPRYGNLQLQPDESRELTLTIKNKEKKPITVSPHVEIQPYGESNFLTLRRVLITSSTVLLSFIYHSSKMKTSSILDFNTFAI